MIKRRNFIFDLLIIIFILGFVSCSDSKPPVFEKGNLIGKYVGSCTVSLGSISEIVPDFPAEFWQKDNQNLNLLIGDDASYQSIGIKTIRTTSEFKDYGSYAGFTLDNFSDSFGNDQIPVFIKNNIILTWDIKSVTLKLNVDSKNSPKYTIASKNLTFTYTGVIEITGKNSGEYYSSPIIYLFNLNKK